MNLKNILIPILLMGLTVRAEDPPVQPPDLRQFRGGEVNVLGEVNKPSRISLPAFSTLLDAIASAGGLTKSAEAHKVLIIHKSSGEKPDTTEVNLAAILTGTAQDVLLQTGDTIVVRATLFIQ
jgi:protein involved in polysaccharide export with SLBB domain